MREQSGLHLSKYLFCCLWELHTKIFYMCVYIGFPGGSVVKNPPANVGYAVLIPRSGRSFGGGHGNPLQYSCLENPMDRGAWRATVHGVAKSRTQLSIHMHVYTRPVKCLSPTGLWPPWEYRPGLICSHVFISSLYQRTWNAAALYEFLLPGTAQSCFSDWSFALWLVVLTKHIS